MDPLAANEALKMLTYCGGRERTPVKSRKWPSRVDHWTGPERQLCGALLTVQHEGTLWHGDRPSMLGVQAAVDDSLKSVNLANGPPESSLLSELRGSDMRRPSDLRNPEASRNKWRSRASSW